MSLSFASELRVAAPLERVFAALTELDQWHHWMPDLVAVERLTPGTGLTTGTRFRETRKVFGKPAAEVFEVVSVSPPRALAFHVDGTQGASKRGHYHFAYSLEPDGADATRIRLDAQVDGLGWFSRLLGRAFVGMLRKGCERDLRALGAHLERVARAA